MFSPTLQMPNGVNGVSGVEIDGTQLRKINILNFVFSALHLVTAIAIFAITDPELTYTFYFTYIEPGNFNGNPIANKPPTAHEVFKFNPGVLSGVFLLLSAVNHFLVALPFRGVYERGLARRMNAFRWVEYSFSASVMRVLVAALSGVNDVHTLFLIVGLTACTMLFGLAFEVENSRFSIGTPVNWLSFGLGFIPHAFAWATIWCNFSLQAVKGSPPDFVWAIIVIVFALDLSFAIALGAQWSRCNATKYSNGEYAFIILSFVSKQLLAWINYSGAAR